jgi:hypothetical protein
MAILGGGKRKIVRKNDGFVVGVKRKIVGPPERKWPTI